MPACSRGRKPEPDTGSKNSHTSAACLELRKRRSALILAAEPLRSDSGQRATTHSARRITAGDREPTAGQAGTASLAPARPSRRFALARGGGRPSARFEALQRGSPLPRNLWKGKFFSSFPEVIHKAIAELPIGRLGAPCVSPNGEKDRHGFVGATTDVRKPFGNRGRSQAFMAELRALQAAMPCRERLLQAQAAGNANAARPIRPLMPAWSICRQTTGLINR